MSAPAWNPRLFAWPRNGVSNSLYTQVRFEMHQGGCKDELLAFAALIWWALCRRYALFVCRENKWTELSNN
jgi:hypothetical protein